ncbi:MAG: citrate synthase 2 [Herpetosiphonaceae bacterium]|nr:MAG: citrate synthase 2 [Herpetosiphonaceae bacterium]
MSMQPVKADLRDVEVLESRITAITPDGLFLRGVPLDELLAGASFEEVAFLLWYGRGPGPSELQALRRALARAWLLPARVLELIGPLRGAEPLSRLQVALPLLALEGPAEEENERRAARILAQVPAVLALSRSGDAAPPLDLNRPLALQIVQALGARNIPARDADMALILYADHELAASTFAARVTAAALSSLYDGMSAAVAVLKGPLHGGSIVEAAHMLRDLAEAPDLDAAVAALLASRRRVPGFGHSVYRRRDPRAAHFLAMAERIAGDEDRRWLQAAERLERAVYEQRGLSCNADLYAAIWMHAAGFDDTMMPGLFATARAAGWTAHMIEQQTFNRLIRPRARYTGNVGGHWPMPS